MSNLNGSGGDSIGKAQIANRTAPRFVMLSKGLVGIFACADIRTRINQRTNGSLDIAGGGDMQNLPTFFSA